MRLKDYDEKEGKRVWLSQEEMEMFIDEAETPVQKVAFLLGGRAGLRRAEIISVTPADFAHSPDGYLRVWEDYAKRENYRETPIPSDLASMVETLAYERDPDEPIVNVSGSTVYRWVRRAAQRLQAQTHDKGWSYLDTHDLRRTWGTDMLGQGVLPSAVMWFGGWNDWMVFRDHYLGEFSPEVLERERNKVNYLGGGTVDEDDQRQHHVPITNKPYANR